MSLDPVSLTKPCRPTSYHHNARRPLPQVETTTTPQRNAKHSKARLKNWFVLATFAASSVETTTLHDQITFHVLTTDNLPAILATTNVLANLPTTTPNLLALISPRPTPHYVTPLTPSLVASLVGDPPHQPERDISAIYNPSTTTPIPTTDAACPPQPS